MKKVVIACLSLFLISVLFAGVTSFVRSDCSVNGTWYNCYPNVDFSGYYGTLSTLTMNYKMELEIETTGVTVASISIEVDDLWQAANLSLDSTVGTTEYWSSGDVEIDISSIPVEGHHEIRFSCGYNDGSGYQFDPEIMYYDMSFDKAEVPMPVTLTSFTAAVLKGTVELAWVTESETENAHFLVYRDGEVIAQVDGHGTTSETHSYSYLDTRVQAGIHSYAISDVTYGGVEELHEAVEVEVQTEAEVAAAFTLGKAYPNPFNPSVTMRYCIEDPLEVDLGVYNMQGEKVANLYSGMHDSGDHSMMWNATDMPSGIYFIRMIAGDMVQTMKVVLMK